MCRVTLLCLLAATAAAAPLQAETNKIHSSAAIAQHNKLKHTLDAIEARLLGNAGVAPIKVVQAGKCDCEPAKHATIATTCSVKATSWKNPAGARRLPCSHAFHPECLARC